MRVALIALFILAGCGGSDSSGSHPPPPPTTVDAGFTGTWNGTTTVTVTGLSPATFQGQLQLQASGGTLFVSNFCPSGGGQLSAVGAGTNVQWTGSFACPAVAFTDCSSVVFTFQSANLQLSGGSLIAQGVANGSGCGVSRSASFSFSGTK